MIKIDIKETRIRALEVTDAADYRAFRLRALRENASAFTSSFEEENLKPMSATLARLATSEYEKLWGGFVGAQIVGMVGMSAETRLKNRHKAALVSMYVAPEYSGQGIGQALVKTVVLQAELSALARLLLTVTSSNHKALALYEKCGFKAFGTELDAIRINGQSFDKIHMSLDLSK
ncbi:Spermidine N(1)-acetyltransferase [Polaromonas vacuolata]|uniref:Spermidine N(1)-acetyltransferase n=1 Tax=Polaromonas vacuolata TaxID=37448 RepID=A0A6H2HE63_9BURK|nr:GNAT family N-acetyltransferase [Polaromonas vacuolata]QJC58158.1 Spermidine N(1)-acetyltransferase [Polaromonas vacuolata]